MNNASSAMSFERFDPQLLTALSGLDWQARYIVEGYLQGRHRSPFHGFSVEFSEYRDYQPGDDLRHLDWRLYGRCDRLCIKKYTQETNVRVYLLVDTSGSMAYRGEAAWGGKLDVARTVAAAMASLLLRQNDAVGLLAFTGEAEGLEFIRPSQKPSQLGILLRHLSGLEPAGGPRLKMLLEHAARLLHRRSVVLFFSDLLEPAEQVREAFQQLRFQGHDCFIFRVLDRDEWEFPFDDASVFEDLETSVRRRVDPSVARARYLERFHAFMKAHDEQFRGLEMPVYEARTDADPRQLLADFFLRREAMP